ncbi:GLABROUS1 enhancer-binding protein-like 1 [Capsella rubella]|uniref:GLABROUS1 enhancer-binding protein-like 1 n=1 Tax=Capsella rubella TaxID=81985 RepID=UPI000CD584D9|nr:GLABROUS1 enhancer-binding protein-like 1 [Capsella rubella]
MVNKKRPCSGDGFSETYTCDLEFRLNNSNGFLPPSPPDSPVLNSPENLDSSNATLLKTRKKRKATLPSYAPDSKRLWTKADELIILKGIVDYRKETGVDYLSDSAAFFEYIKDDIDTKFSKDQLVNKIKKLKFKFRDNLVKKPSFANSQDSETFDLSMAIWGKDKAGCVDGNTAKPKRTRSKVQAFVEHEVVTNGEPENDDGLAEGGDSFDKLPSENPDKIMENENGGKEIEEDGAVTNNMGNETGGKEGEEDGAVTKDKPENKFLSVNVDDNRMEKETGEKGSEEDGAADELCALQDALETTVFQHLGSYAQKQMLEKLKTLRAKERKELSGEWKSLLVEEALFKSKKYSFTAKLANAAFHN